MTATLPMTAILLLAAGTYAFRLAGPLLHERLRSADALAAPLTAVTAVLLLALAATSALTEGQEPAGWARPIGVLTALLLALRRAPFPAVVIAAAATTALLRLCGIP